MKKAVKIATAAAENRAVLVHSGGWNSNNHQEVGNKMHRNNACRTQVYQNMGSGNPINREQKRDIRKAHIKFLKTPWMAGCPWDTQPVSQQKCPFLSVFL